MANWKMSEIYNYGVKSIADDWQERFEKSMEEIAAYEAEQLKTRNIVEKFGGEGSGAAYQKAGDLFGDITGKEQGYGYSLFETAGKRPEIYSGKSAFLEGYDRKLIKKAQEDRKIRERKVSDEAIDWTLDKIGTVAGGAGGKYGKVIQKATEFGKGFTPGGQDSNVIFGDVLDEFRGIPGGPGGGSQGIGQGINPGVQAVGDDIVSSGIMSGQDTQSDVPISTQQAISQLMHGEKQKSPLEALMSKEFAKVDYSQYDIGDEDSRLSDFLSKIFAEGN